jgi:hypothetical protein
MTDYTKEFAPFAYFNNRRRNTGMKVLAALLFCVTWSFIVALNELELLSYI